MVGVIPFMCEMDNTEYAEYAFILMCGVLVLLSRSLLSQKKLVFFFWHYKAEPAWGHRHGPLCGAVRAIGRSDLSAGGQTSGRVIITLWDAGLTQDWVLSVLQNHSRWVACWSWAIQIDLRVSVGPHSYASFKLHAETLQKNHPVFISSRQHASPLITCISNILQVVPSF